MYVYLIQIKDVVTQLLEHPFFLPDVARIYIKYYAANANEYIIICIMYVYTAHRQTISANLKRP